MDAFWTWSLVVVVPLLLAAMAGAHELGMGLHARLMRGTGAEDGGAGSDEGFILSGVLGLLALLMGFSFSMALNRLEDRRDLMLQETSAVGYLAMLADALPQERARPLKADIAAYGAARLAAAEMADGPERLAAAEQAAALREPVAAKVRAVLREAGAKGGGGPFEVALAKAYDTVEDTAVRRQALTQAHIPPRVLWLLAVYAVISAAMLGYALAGARARHRVASSTLYLLVALAFGVILDLDRPRAGAITVDQAPFARTVEAVAREAAAP
ncbi:hypothetical protein ACLBKU_14085 [Erythrobacter sp. NE805]|uniref:bestrophin-like domain n=1 Tax=Erythrobacter sp. NE805 TaxID=3389875 RepID=UPI00396B13B7